MSAPSEVLENLHASLAKELMEKIKAGDSSPALLNVARQFLRDNGIESLPTSGSTLEELMKTLPDFNSDAKVFETWQTLPTNTTSKC